MFITNGDEIINLNAVRVVQLFPDVNPIIRLDIDETRFSLLRFQSKENFNEAKTELMDMLRNISEDWDKISDSMYVRTDKLIYAEGKGIGSQLILYMDTGCIKSVQSPIYKVMDTLIDATGAISFED
jgi:hypothetical protein